MFTVCSQDICLSKICEILLLTTRFSILTIPGFAGIHLQNRQLALVVNAFLFMREEVLVPNCCHKHRLWLLLWWEVPLFNEKSCGVFWAKPYFQGFCENPVKPEEAQQRNNSSCSQEVLCARSCYWKLKVKKNNCVHLLSSVCSPSSVSQGACHAYCTAESK